MRGLFAKLENPAVTGLSATFSEAKADLTPATLPDLYRDEPLVLAAKLDKLAGSVEIKGKIGDRPWSVTLPLANAAEGQGPVETLGAPQDQRRRGRTHHAAARPGGRRQDHPRRSRSSISS